MPSRSATHREGPYTLQHMGEIIPDFDLDLSDFDEFTREYYGDYQVLPDNFVDKVEYLCRKKFKYSTLL